MSTIKLGELVDDKQDRDAIHIAIVPMKASELLRPGQRVGLIGDDECEAGPSENCVGIVDPYLVDVVPKGAVFWLFLLPNTVTGMRHHWEHPEFQNDQLISQAMQKENARMWLIDQCDPLGMSFEELTSRNSELVNGGYIKTHQNESARDHWYEIEDQFWRFLEIYTGQVIKESDRGGFTCSC